MNDALEPPPGQWRVAQDPRYYVRPSPLTGGVLLSLRDPDGEWRHFQIPPNEVPTLVKLLVECSAAVPEDSGNKQ